MKRKTRKKTQDCGQRPPGIEEREKGLQGKGREAPPKRGQEKRGRKWGERLEVAENRPHKEMEGTPGGWRGGPSRCGTAGHLLTQRPTCIPWAGARGEKGGPHPPRNSVGATRSHLPGVLEGGQVSWGPGRRRQECEQGLRRAWRNRVSRAPGVGSLDYRLPWKPHESCYESRSHVWLLGFITLKQHWKFCPSVAQATCRGLSSLLWLLAPVPGSKDAGGSTGWSRSRPFSRENPNHHRKTGSLH